MVDLLKSVCDWSRDAPILVAVFARPEFLDEYPNWGAGRMNAVTALLEPLSDDDVDSLTAGWLGGVLPGGSADRVRETAGGNPLFVEQLLAMLVEDGVLHRDGARWRLDGDVKALKVPPTITALLAARLDRLSTPERAVLGPAAVIGQVFYPAAVSELAAMPTDQVAVQLRSLIRKGLLRPTRSDLAGHEGLRFGHVLIRDAAYGALPKAARADLHERFARWLDKTTEGRAYDDLVGDHLESAYLLRTELGLLDVAAQDLGLEASHRLQAAAAQLRVVDDMRAIGLLERADRLREDSGPQRWALQLELARVLLAHTLRLPHVVRVCEQVRAQADTAGEPAGAMRARVLLALQRQRSTPEGATELLRNVASEAMAVFEAADDHDALMLAHMALVDSANMDLRLAEMQEHLHHAAEHAERAGRPHEAHSLRQSATFGGTFSDLDGLGGPRQRAPRPGRVEVPHRAWPGYAERRVLRRAAR